MARALVVEDDPDIGEVIIDILRLDQHQTQRTPSGREALLLASAQPWDLIILDLELDDLSGPAVQRAVRDFSRVPLLVMSASCARWREEAFALGATACLAKPFDVQELRALVSALVGPREPERALRVETLSAADLATLSALSKEQLDTLPYGVIQLDRRGVIVGFNRYESQAVSMKPEAVMGRRFVDIAPCTKVQRFVGEIERGFEQQQLDRSLRFVFPAFGGLAIVVVRLYYDAPTGRMWLFVSRLGQPERSLDNRRRASRESGSSR